MPFLIFDNTFLLLIPAFILAVWAQSHVKSTFNKFSRVQAASGMSGFEVARRLLDDGGLSDIQVEEIEGNLSDHYDPRSRTLRLSSGTARSRSVASLGVAAHEVGHAIQHQKAYAAFQVRQSIVPVASIGSSLSFPIFFIGFLFAQNSFLMNLGIYLFCGAVVFQLITLPVEFNASSRALVLLSNRGYLVDQEITQAKKVLNAAALTYVAATAVAVMHLLRLILLRGSRS